MCCWDDTDPSESRPGSLTPGLQDDLGRLQMSAPPISLGDVKEAIGRLD